MKSISFIHSGGPKMASYRYRAAMPAKSLGVPTNDYSADVLVFCKPTAAELIVAQKLAKMGSYIIVDICDDHFDQPHYHEFLSLANDVVCPTKVMQALIAEQGREDAHVIEDPYEFAELAPHLEEDRVLWFGHSSNLPSLQRILPDLDGYPLTVVSNTLNSIPWSVETLQQELARNDIVVLPATRAYKSANRAVEAIRSGCCVIAEPHPAWADFPIYQGYIREGIEWALKHKWQANQLTSVAQDYVRQRFSPATQASAWKKLLASVSILAAAKSAGLDGSMWIH